MKKRSPFGTIQFNFPFLNYCLFAVTVLTILILFALWNILNESQYSSKWQINLFLLQFNFVGVLLTFFITMFILLHRSLGAINRVEKILENVERGEYGLRIKLRKSDLIASLADKINNVLDLLEKKARN
jgi:signal transduction histidine kinase